MNTLQIKKIELYNLIPSFNIQEIEDLISIATKFKKNIKTEKRSLAGIWSKYNFEDIDLDEEIREIRKEIEVI